MPKNLEASVDVDAAPERVWSVVSDLERMPEWSPQCIRMKVLGDVRKGAWTVNFNKDGWKRWPTTARVVRYEPGRLVAFRINENRTVWSFEVAPTATGTRITQRRDVPHGQSWFSRKLIDYTLGGEQKFEGGLVEGMHESLDKIKAAAERP